MAEGTFPDLAARELDEVEVSGVPMASSSQGEVPLIVDSGEAAVRHEVIEPGQTLPA